MSRLATIGDGTDTYATYKYLGAGRIVVEDYEDIDVKLDYAANNFAALDRFGRVVDQVWTDYGADPDVVLDEYTYTYDRAGNRTSRDNELHSAFDEDYTYDDLDRLTDSDRADDFDQSWGLDGLGNFGTFDDDGASQTRTVNAANEITDITGGWITPAYDAAGNMISGPKPGDETTRIHYVYDAWNRLVAVKADDSGEPGDLIAEYEYDGVESPDREGRHRRRRRTGALLLLQPRVATSRRALVDDEGEPIAIEPIRLVRRATSTPRSSASTTATATATCLDAGDNIRYYTGDANYNVTATIDAATGDVVERYVYTAYGKATVYDDDWANPAAPTTDGPLYCGYFFDAETALYQVRNRYYDSSLSVFVSRDPILYASGDVDLYRYVANSPVAGIDPNGLSDCSEQAVTSAVKPNSTCCKLTPMWEGWGYQSSLECQ